MRKTFRKMLTMMVLFIILLSGFCFADEIDPIIGKYGGGSAYSLNEVQEIKNNNIPTSFIVIGFIVIVITLAAIITLKNSKKKEEEELKEKNI